MLQYNSLYSYKIIPLEPILSSSDKDNKPRCSLSKLQRKSQYIQGRHHRLRLVFINILFCFPVTIPHLNLEKPPAHLLLYWCPHYAPYQALYALLCGQDQDFLIPDSHIGSSYHQRPCDHEEAIDGLPARLLAYPQNASTLQILDQDGELATLAEGYLVASKGGQAAEFMPVAHTRNDQVQQVGLRRGGVSFPIR